MTRRLRASMFISLDGVVQAPGGPSEDPTGGFAHGGWLAPYDDPVTDEFLDGLLGGDYDLLLARRTYEIFEAYWPQHDAVPIGARFNRARKHVVTTTRGTLDWANSALLPGDLRADLAGAVAALKHTDGPDIIIQGSRSLYAPLLAAGLIDELTLITAPVVLGRGKRLFDDGFAPVALTPTAFVRGASGVTVATYAPGGAVRTGTFGGGEPSASEVQRQQRMAEGTW